MNLFTVFTLCLYWKLCLLLYNLHFLLYNKLDQLWVSKSHFRVVYHIILTQQIFAPALCPLFVTAPDFSIYMNSWISCYSNPTQQAAYWKKIILHWICQVNSVNLWIHQCNYVPNWMVHYFSSFGHSTTSDRPPWHRTFNVMQDATFYLVRR